MVKVSLNIPDTHIPFHCQKSYDLMLQIAKDVDEDIGITEINILGDYLDFFWVSLHPKGPASSIIRESFKDEIYEGIKKLTELRNLFPKAKINFLEGNHEFRLVRYIVSKCPELYDLYSLPDILCFDKLNIEYHPFGKGQKVSCLGTNLFMRHQPYNQGRNCAATTAHNKGISLLFGHTHRLQNYTLIKGDGEEVSTYSSGWLGDRTLPAFEYMDTDDWGTGFTMTYAFSEKDWHLHQIHIKNGRTVYNGSLYEI